MSYQVITNLAWRHQPATNSDFHAQSEALRSAIRLIMNTANSLAQSEVNEVFLEAIPEVMSEIGRESDRLFLDQVSVLLDIWLERGRPNWKYLVQDLTKAKSLLESLSNGAEAEVS